MKAKVVSQEELKQMCEQFLEVCISGSDDDIRHFGEDVEVRFINDDGSFGYTYVCDLFFYHDRMYYWSQRKTQKEHLTLNDFELEGSLEILEIFGDIKIFPVIFAGVYTGYQDDKGQKIFTGDVLKATALMEADMISEGGRTRARMCNGKDHGGATFIAGIDYFGHRRDDYYYILDNCPIAMKYTKRAKVIGNVFYDLDRDCMVVNIRERCSMLAFPYNINIRNLHIKMAHSPYFISKTWQEKALKILKDEPLYEELSTTLQ